MDGQIETTPRRTLTESKAETSKLSLDQIAFMVSNGIPVPDIKQIPDTILKDPKSFTIAPIKKPWEK